MECAAKARKRFRRALRDQIRSTPLSNLIADRFQRGYFDGRKVDLAAALRLNQRFARFKLRGTPNWQWHEQREQPLSFESRFQGC